MGFNQLYCMACVCSWYTCNIHPDCLHVILGHALFSPNTHWPSLGLQKQSKMPHNRQLITLGHSVCMEKINIKPGQYGKVSVLDFPMNTLVLINNKSKNLPHLQSPSTSLCHLGSRCPGLTAWCAGIFDKSENTDTKIALTCIILRRAWHFKTLVRQVTKKA